MDETNPYKSANSKGRVRCSSPQAGRVFLFPLYESKNEQIKKEEHLRSNSINPHAERISVLCVGTSRKVCFHDNELPFIFFNHTCLPIARTCAFSSSFKGANRAKEPSYHMQAAKALISQRIRAV